MAHATRHRPGDASCVRRPRPVAEPELRVLLLHPAGGSSSTFRAWVPLFPPAWEVCLLDAPGRGRVRTLPPFRELSDLVDYLLDGLDGLLDRPFAVFGHSMGALVGFALTLAARATGRPLPVWLGLSAHPGPRTEDQADRIELHRFDSDQLRGALRQLGGVPAEVVTDDIIWSLVEPLLRNDLLLTETWRPAEPVPVVPVPISVYCGDADRTAGPATTGRWARHTTRFLGVRTFSGDHFYFRHDPAPVVASIVADITSVRNGLKTA